MASSRKRGAQPGNTNALKHGFYTHAFKALELEDLDKLSDGLVDEIALVRICIRRLFELASAETPNLEDMSMVLNTTGAAAIRLAHLIRTHKYLTGSDSEFATALATAITQVTRELGC